MRCFIGMRVAHPERVETIQAGLDLGDVRFTDSHNVHLTLLFLGDISETSASDICAYIIQGGFGDLKALPAKITGLPSLRKARIVALIVENDMINEYHDSICSSLNLREDRKFLPHITIGRARKPVDISMYTERNSDLGEPILLERPALYRSTLTARGPVYEKIC